EVRRMAGFFTRQRRICGCSNAAKKELARKLLNLVRGSRNAPTEQHLSPGVDMNPQEVMKLIQENEVRFVDLRFTDTRGKEQHVGLPVSAFEEEHFEQGHPFDGSSIAGWKGIQASDMILMPDASSAYIDPFYDE